MDCDTLIDIMKDIRDTVESGERSQIFDLCGYFSSEYIDSKKKAIKKLLKYADKIQSIYNGKCEPESEEYESESEEYETESEEYESESEEIIPKRTIRKPKHKNEAYFNACNEHQKQCHPRGGFIAGSGRHYDRRYDGKY